ncbi:MAG: SIMPL domain-containing protein [Pseudomonadota bacterium]
MRFLALVFCAMLATTASAEPPVPSISLTGQGSVTVVPDMATISIGVETADKTAGEALAANTEQAGAVIAALKDAGLDAKDIRTSNFSIQPVYNDRKSISSGAPRITGYRVFNNVTARIRALDGLGKVLDRVVSTGANRIGGISFGLAEDGDARDEARRLAVADARRKAELYADAAGVTLGPILSISEAGGNFGPRPMAQFEMARASAPVPVEAGSAAITAQVSISWQISGP